MNKKQLGILQAKRHLRTARTMQESVREYKNKALKIFYQLGYCDCAYPYWGTDENGNCHNCGKPSRASIVDSL